MEERFFKYAVAGLLATVIIDNQDVILKKIRSLIRWIKEKLTKRPIEVPCESEISPESDIEVTGMEALLCPISHELMRNPVITPYGHCFEKSQIET